MQFFTWWIWLIVAVLAWITAALRQINHMQRLARHGPSGNVSVFSGLGLTMVLGIIGGTSFILFLISIISDLLKR